MINQDSLSITFVILSCFFLMFSINDILFQKINNFIVLAGLVVNFILYIYFKTLNHDMRNSGAVVQKLIWMTIFIYSYNHGFIGAGDVKMIVYLLTIPFFYNESRKILLLFSGIVSIFFLIGKITQKKKIKLAPIMLVSVFLTMTF